MVHPIVPLTKAAARPFAKVRSICLSLAGAEESMNHGRPCFVVRGKTFAMFLENHHGDGRLAIWCKAPPGEQAAMVDADPSRFFVPPYVGPRGWIGVRLDLAAVDWDDVAAIVRTSHQMTAPKRALREKPAAKPARARRP
jgi:hypothetical protein